MSSDSRAAPRKAASSRATAAAGWPPSVRVRIVIASDIVEDLSRAAIGATFNFYRDGERAALCCRRLAAYLEAHREAPILLVGEAPGYRGTRISGIPFTSERQLTGAGPAEVTATIVHRVLTQLCLEQEVLLWNVVPTHPGTASSNRQPTRTEVDAGRPFLHALARGRRPVAVGRLAHAAIGGPYVRHPAHGGAIRFARDLETVSASMRR